MLLCFVLSPKIVDCLSQDAYEEYKHKEGQETFFLLKKHMGMCVCVCVCVCVCNVKNFRVLFLT